MFEIIGSGLILAIISGLAFVAYNHPKYYEKLAYILFGLNQIFYIVAINRDYSVNKTFENLQDFIDPSKIKEAQLSINTILTPDWVFITSVLVTVGLIFLLFLPKEKSKQ